MCTIIFFRFWFLDRSVNRLSGVVAARRCAWQLATVDANVLTADECRALVDAMREAGVVSDARSWPSTAWPEEADGEAVDRFLYRACLMLPRPSAEIQQSLLEVHARTNTCTQTRVRTRRHVCACMRAGTQCRLLEPWARPLILVYPLTSEQLA